MQLRHKARSWSPDPAGEPQREVLYQDEHGGFHVLIAWTDYHTSLCRLAEAEAHWWMRANGHEIPRELCERK
jgi:hypothetical protein